MSFSRKQYETVARIIREGRTYVNAYPMQDGTQDYARGYRQALTRVTSELSAMFAADNPRFDAERFARACEPDGAK